jgi:hypothetical protein
MEAIIRRHANQDVVRVDLTDGEAMAWIRITRTGYGFIVEALGPDGKNGTTLDVSRSTAAFSIDPTDVRVEVPATILTRE